MWWKLIVVFSIAALYLFGFCLCRIMADADKRAESTRFSNDPLKD
jgi:hypothetical protein